MDWFDMCPISLVEALKWGQTNNPTRSGTNIMMEVVLINCQNLHSHWITGLKSGPHKRRGLGEEEEKYIYIYFVSLQVRSVKLHCTKNLRAHKKRCIMLSKFSLLLKEDLFFLKFWLVLQNLAFANMLHAQHNGYGFDNSWEVHFSHYKKKRWPFQSTVCSSISKLWTEIIWTEEQCMYSVSPITVFGCFLTSERNDGMLHNVPSPEH